MAQQGARRTARGKKEAAITTEQLRVARAWLERVQGTARAVPVEGGEDPRVLATTLNAGLGAVLEREFPRYTRHEQAAVLDALRSVEARAWAPVLERFLREPSLAYQVRLALAELLGASGREVATDIMEPLRQAQALEARLRDRVAQPLGEANGWRDLLEELQSLAAPLAAAVLQGVAGSPQALPLLEQLVAQNDPRLLPAAVEALCGMASPEAAALLGQIAAQASSKELQKAARRALYRLKTAGVETERVLRQAPRKSVLEVPKLPVVAALASHIDFNGTRALYLARRRPFSGLVFVGLLLNDRHGLSSCDGLPVTKKDLTRILTDIRANEQLTHVDIPPSYAQQLIEEAYQRNLSTGTPVPRDFLGLRDVIGTPDRVWEQSPIYHVVNPEEVRAQPTLLSLSESLLSIKEFRSWHVAPAALEPYQTEVNRVLESPIVVSPALQQERIAAIQQKAMRELFDADECARYRRRLEEMAYVLWQTKRPDEARRALAAALALQEESLDAAKHPFMRALFERSIEIREALEREEQGRVTIATPRLWTP